MKDKEYIKNTATMILIIIVIITFLLVTLLSGCTSQAITGNEKGTIVAIGLEEGGFFDEEKVVVEFGNDSKAILKFTRYDEDGIDWYDYLSEHIGDYVSINWAANSNEAMIISVEILEKPCKLE